MTSTNQLTTRTWNAAIIIDGEALPVDLTNVADLQEDTTKAALALTASLLTSTSEQSEFVTYKTTKAHGTVANKAFTVRWNDRRRTFVAQGWAAYHAPNPFTTA